MKIILIIPIAISFGSIRNDYNFVKTTKKVNLSIEKIDTSRIAVFQFDNKDTLFFSKGVRGASLSAKEINQIELLINDAVVEKHKKDGNYFNIQDTSEYYKQVIAVINSNGDKIVWVNCLCSIAGCPYWRKNIIGVLDGGVCYFNLKINLSKNVAFDFYVNNYE